MQRRWIRAGMLMTLLCFTGCQTTAPAPDPNVERGPKGTIAYDVLIEASEPGAKIEASGQIIGETPLHLKIFGDKDGTFHDFGSDFYVIRAIPLATNQYAQMRMFGTGRWFGPEDRIPSQIYFDMNQREPEYPPRYPYPYPMPYYYYPPPYYYGPAFYYSAPYYYNYHYHHHHGGGGIHVHPKR